MKLNIESSPLFELRNYSHFHLCDEVSETVRNERSGKLLDGEKVVVDAGGCIIRLGGLYTLER